MDKKWITDIFREHAKGDLEYLESMGKEGQNIFESFGIKEEMDKFIEEEKTIAEGNIEFFDGLVRKEEEDKE